MGELKMSKKLSFSVRMSDDSTKYIHGDTIDELIDAIEELKDVEFIINFIKEFRNLSKEQYERLENVVLTSNSIDEICKYAMGNKQLLINIEKFEELIIESENNKRIIQFAQFINGANIERLEDAVIKSKDKNSIRDFFYAVKCSNPEKIKKALLDGEKDAITIFDFIITKRARGYTIDIDEIKEVDNIIIASNDASLCGKWAEKNMEGINVSKLEDIVIQYGGGSYIINFAKYVKGANIAKLEDAIIKIDDASLLYCFATVIQGANLYKIRKALKVSKDEKKEKYIRKWKDQF